MDFVGRPDYNGAARCRPPWARGRYRGPLDSVSGAFPDPTARLEAGRLCFRGESPGGSPDPEPGRGPTEGCRGKERRRAVNRYLRLHRLPVLGLWIVLVLMVAFPVGGRAELARSKMDATLQRAETLARGAGHLPAAVPGVKVEGGEVRVNAFIQVEGDPTPLRELGVEIFSKAGDVYLARVPVERLSEVASLPEVVRMEGDARVEPLLDVSVPEIGADRIWNEQEYEPPHPQGEGVIVGMVDTGIDLAHEDFRTLVNGEEVSRVLWTWDMGDPSGGTECNPREEDCRIEDEVGHGTSVMGVMAGGGRGECRGAEGRPCRGVAPRADMVVVKLGDGLASEVIQGVEYIFQKAAALGEPAVVNLSVGWYAGPRDGSSLLERALTNLLGPGRILVSAAGNQALEMGHARMSVGNATARKTLYIDCIPAVGDQAVVYGWYDAPASGTVEVRVLNYHEEVHTGWVGPDDPEEILDSPYGRVSVQQIAHADGDGKTPVEIQIVLESGRSRLALGQWHVEARGSGLGGTVRVDLWVDKTFSLGSSGDCRKPIRFMKGDADPGSTIAPPCTANQVICVGSYNTRCDEEAGSCTGCSLDYGGDNCWKDWPQADPEGPFRDWTEQEGDLSSFSSLGPRRDGAELPTISAPGQVILAPDNRGEYSYVAGTSFAAPHVAGTVALMLEADPGLMPSQVRQALVETARPPEGRPNENDLEDLNFKLEDFWGAGMLDAYEAFTRVAPPIEPHGLGKGDDWCFIATAVFRDLDAPQVELLRRMRDRLLLPHAWGRAFVRTYYRWSPPVADWLKGHRLASEIVRVGLLPLVGGAEMAYGRDGSGRAGLALVVLLLPGVLVLVARRRRRP